jgi:superfamily II DNA or RNA helicase
MKVDKMNKINIITSEFDKIASILDKSNAAYNKMCTGFELYGEEISDKEYYQQWIEEFEGMSQYMRHYNKDFWKIEVYINELKEIGLPFDELSKILSKFQELKNATIKMKEKIDEMLIGEYRNDNISKAEERPINEYLTKIVIKVKGIPYDILEEVSSDYCTIDINEAEYEPVNEYFYEISSCCEKDNVTDTVRILYLYTSKVLKKMMDSYDYKTLVYGHYEGKIYSRLYSYQNNLFCKVDPNRKPHNWQNEAYKAWKENKYKGIFKVATGCGKTWFAFTCIQKIIEMGFNIQVRIIVPTLALLNQWVNKLEKEFHVNPSYIGKVGGGNRQKNKRFTIYTVDSALNYFEDDIETYSKVNNPKLFQFIIADECHNYGSSNDLKMLRSLEKLACDTGTGINYFSIGLSATPERTFPWETKQLEEMLGNIIYDYDIIRALADGIVATPTIQDICIGFTEEEYTEYMKIKKTYDKKKQKLEDVLKRYHVQYNEEFLVHFAGDIMQDKEYKEKLNIMYNMMHTYKKNRIFSEEQWLYEFEEWFKENSDKSMEIARAANEFIKMYWKKNEALSDMGYRHKEFLNNIEEFKKHRVIIFTERVNVARTLYNKLVEKCGSDKVEVYFTDKEEKGRIRKNIQALNNFKEGKANILVAVNALDEGVDVPDVDMAFIHQGKPYERQQIQRLGRIIRKIDKENTKKEETILYNLFCPIGGENIYLAKFFRRVIMKYREEGYGELQDTYKRGLKALGYDMDVELKQLKNYEYLRIEE